MARKPFVRDAGAARAGGEAWSALCASVTVDAIASPWDATMGIDKKRGVLRLEVELSDLLER